MKELGLQSASAILCQCAATLPATKMKERMVNTMEIISVCRERSIGSIKLDTTPCGGGPDGTEQRSTPGGI